MASKVVDNYRNGAEISKGDAECKTKSVEVLKELGLPTGLFPLQNIEEFGYNQNAGFYEASKEKVTFKTGTGLSDSFDVAAFELLE
ncbi:hypothetical protein LUZ62_018531 [Rhynchospora pubera]|uniref:Uncharacterized protein n=1 Tax=Rhynchospora pubera TaxID=906938 RepID=A0AAV8GQR6_9POAL|nr:hypothetical protein LUZ62_018531 [Rhynchospora pubera]